MLCFIMDLHALCRRIFVCLLSEASCGTGFWSFLSLRYYTTNVSVMLGLSFASLYAPETQRMAIIALKMVHDKAQVLP
jgi:hypothetical protein